MPIVWVRHDGGGGVGGRNKDTSELEFAGLCDGLIIRNLDWICGQKCY